MIRRERRGEEDEGRGVERNRRAAEKDGEVMTVGGKMENGRGVCTRERKKKKSKWIPQKGEGNEEGK